MLVAAGEKSGLSEGGFISCHRVRLDQANHLFPTGFTPVEIAFALRRVHFKCVVRSAKAKKPPGNRWRRLLKDWSLQPMPFLFVVVHQGLVVETIHVGLDASNVVGMSKHLLHHAVVEKSKR